MSFEDRFWAKVQKTDRCWWWTGAKTKAGYGLILRDKKLVYAHRAAWEMKHGPIPSGLHVLHRCDHPACIHHLFLGTPRDNVEDMIQKGRDRKAVGVENGKFKHSEAVLQRMRELSTQGLGCRAIGRELNINHSYISNILRGKRRATNGVGSRATKPAPSL